MLFLVLGPASSSMPGASGVVVGESSSVDNVAASRAICVPDLAGEVTPADVTPVDEAASSRSACIPASVCEDDFDIPLRDLFFATYLAVGLESTVPVSSHVGESACPPEKKTADVARTASVECQTNIDALSGTPLPQFQEILDLGQLCELQREVVAFYISDYLVLLRW